MFVLAKRRSVFFYSALEGQRGGWLPRPPKCPHLVLPSVASPGRLPCAVPTRPACCVSRFRTRQVYIVVFRDLLGGIRVFAEVHRVSEHSLTSFKMSDTKGEDCTDLGDADIFDAVNAVLDAWQSGNQLVQVDNEHVTLVHAAECKNKPTTTP